MKKPVFVFALAVQLATSTTEAAQRLEEPSYRIDQAPDRLFAGVEIADAAIRDLQRRLSARLQEELHKGGPTRAQSR